jgi:hypothetical protein
MENYVELLDPFFTALKSDINCVPLIKIAIGIVSYFSERQRNDSPRSHYSYPTPWGPSYLPLGFSEILENCRNIQNPPVIPAPT